MRIFLITMLCVPLLLFSTEFKPWLDKSTEFLPRATYELQSYQYLNTGDGKQRYTSNDSFATLGIAVCPYLGMGDLGAWWSKYPWELELEMTLANTRYRSFGFDNICLTGRYRWMDDVTDEDYVTLTTGVTLIQAWTLALKDPSSFHHGRIEVEGHAAVGKEMDSQCFWLSRWWGLAALGAADIGSPWIRGELVWESNYQETYEIRLFTKGLLGFGGENLFYNESFAGYGPIRHRSVDLGFRFSYIFDIWGTLDLEYSYRVFARNFPENTNIFLASYVFPFGL